MNTTITVIERVNENKTEGDYTCPYLGSSPCSFNNHPTQALHQRVGYLWWWADVMEFLLFIANLPANIDLGIAKTDIGKPWVNNGVLQDDQPLPGEHVVVGFATSPL